LYAAETGDEIVAHAGHYVENIDFLGKNLWLHSDQGPQATIIDGSQGLPGQASCVVFQTGELATAILEGFTLTHGSGSRHLSLEQGGAILCLHSSPTLRNLIVESNEAQGGAGAYLGDSNPEIVDCLFQDNHATLGGALKSSAEGCSPKVRRCVFQSNTASWGGGAVHFDPGGGLFEECEFRGNLAETGGAISLGSYGPGPLFRACTFTDNQATVDLGGAFRLHESDATLLECLLFDNSASEYGGGVFAMDGAHLYATNCTFYGNTAGSRGGNLAAHYESELVLLYCIVAMAGSGGGVSCVSGTISFVCNDVWGNTGGNYLGCPDPTGTAGNISVDPLFCSPETGDFTITDCSPCAPEHNECGHLFGALDVGCPGTTPAQSTTWGAVKRAFRP